GLRPEHVTAIDNGVDPFFSPGYPPVLKSPVPLVVAAGRMAPVKRFGLLLEAAAEARSSVPDLRLRLIGDGPLRGELVAWVQAHGAQDWVDLPGHLDRPALRDEYRRAWVVASGSLAEGWGLTMTEAGAWGTTAAPTDLRGHPGSVR